MSLQEKLKSTAQELVILLEQSEKEHQEFIKERDARLSDCDKLEAEIIQLASRINKLLEEHLQTIMFERAEIIRNKEQYERQTSLWNRLLDLDAQIASAVFSNRPYDHLKLLAARLTNRYS